MYQINMVYRSGFTNHRNENNILVNSIEKGGVLMADDVMGKRRRKRNDPYIYYNFIVFLILILLILATL